MSRKVDLTSIDAIPSGKNTIRKPIACETWIEDNFCALGRLDIVQVYGLRLCKYC